MGKQESGSDVVRRLRQAESEKNWREISYILDNIDTLTEEDIRALEPVMPRLITHRDYLIRASAVDVVGLFQLRQFLDLVKARLDDRNKIARSYALEAYYELLGRESLPAVRKYCEDRSLQVRVTALSVCYAATGDETCLARLEKILLRRDCD
jgi:HEAT repeat protein